MAVDVEGETAYVLSEDVDELMATPATEAVRLLPGHDQWVIGSGHQGRARGAARSAYAGHPQGEPRGRRRRRERHVVDSRRARSW